MVRSPFNRALSALGLVALVALVGCSGDNPVAPTKTSVPSGQDTNTGTVPSAEVEIYGRVASTDPVTRKLTLVGQQWDIYVSPTAEIVTKVSGDETPIPFGDIQLGDSVDIRGFAGTTAFNANRVRVRHLEHGAEQEFGGRVLSTDTTINLLRLANDARSLYVSENAEMIQRTENGESHIAFSEVMPGDSVELKGFPQPDGSLLITRLRVRLDQSGDFRTEIEFKDTIVAIDYTLGTLQTLGGWYVSTDSLTFVYHEIDPDESNTTVAARRGADDVEDSLKIRIQFSDLKIGDYVEVHGNWATASTVYAVAIELEDGELADRGEVQFKDRIASVDLGTLTVTFEGGQRIGVLDPTALLFDLNNQPIQLSAFTTGMIVEVHGFAEADNTLRVTRMEMEDNF